MVAVEGEIEGFGARLDPGEMAFELEKALFRIETHRLDQVESAAGLDEAALGQTFAPYARGVAVGDDPGAETNPSHGYAAPHHQGPDRDVERRTAVRRDMTDRAG